MRQLQVLGTPLLVTDYETLTRQCEALASEDQVVAIEFANTQIVTMRRHDSDFLETTSGYDFFSPDGMPLVWCLNRAGARMKDRVYGPAFMRYFLMHAPTSRRHYLLGGSEECGARLRDIFSRERPGIQFVGSFHGRCDTDGRIERENEVLADIERLAPDFLWIGFGSPKQQAWVRRYKSRLRRGVVLSVGFAFDVNAGMKPDAPRWMHKRGLTWIHRLWSEPRRLGPRYLKWNSLFLWYLFRDALQGKAWSRPDARSPATQR